jgi:hypothetical protein
LESVPISTSNLAALAYHSFTVGIVHHGHHTIALGDLVQLVQRCNVAVHAEYPVRDQDAASIVRQILLDHTLRVGSIAVLVHQYLGARQAAAVDDRGMVEPVGEDHVLLPHQR